MADGAALIGLDVVLAALARNDHHAEEAGTVALDKDVLRVIHGHAVHHEVVSVDLRTRAGDLDGPDVVRAAGHVDGVAIGIRHPGAGKFHDRRVVGAETEGDAVTLDVGGYDGSHAAAEVEIGQFLGVERSDEAERGDESKDLFHLSGL